MSFFSKFKRFRKEDSSLSDTIDIVSKLLSVTNRLENLSDRLEVLADSQEGIDERPDRPDRNK